MFKAIFCKLYLWNSKYAITKGSAAEKTMYALSFFIMLNLLSVLFIAAYLIGYSLKSIPIELIASIVMGIPIVIVVFLYRVFIRHKKYLLLCNKDSLINNKYYGFSSRGITLLYIGFSLFLFAIAMIIFVRAHYTS